MFRISQFMRELAAATPGRARRAPSGPVVIWNLVRRCNLTCKHCYSISTDRDFPGELSTAEVFDVMDDLKRFGVPALILSGGEPLLRPDIFEVAERARALGFYVGLSTNGTLIGEHNVASIAAARFDYVGVSLDGLRDTHDRFRRSPGAFDRSLAGLRLCRDAGIKVGVRFTLAAENAADLPALLHLIEQEGFDRFYLSHLNYAGRGAGKRCADAQHRVTRQAMETLFDTSWDHVSRGLPSEFVSGNNDADGAFLLMWVQRHFPERAADMRGKLAQWGGNSSGVNIANIDNLGNVHPDTMWWHHTLGNVRQRPFSRIWTDTSDPILAGLKAVPRRTRRLGGRCANCVHFDLCAGNTRVRAHQMTGDPWGADPGCYLTDSEIGQQEARCAAC
jgi:Fe-coproporphyrin III synthase